MIEFLSRPWPWYVSGPLLGLMVPLLLFLGNKHFGVSSSFQHICAAVLPTKAEYFKYNWKSKAWNLVLMAGVVAGAAIAVLFLGGNQAPPVSDGAKQMFQSWGLAAPVHLQPLEIFAIRYLPTPSNLIVLIGGGFLVGFGTRYGNGCTSGHAIMGLSLLNLGSLVATMSFFAGGLIFSNFVLPAILALS